MFPMRKKGNIKICGFSFAIQTIGDFYFVTMDSIKSIIVLTALSTLDDFIVSI